MAAGLDAGVGATEFPHHPGGIVAEVLSVARETGAPRARMLRVVADSLESNGAVQREAELASVSARQSARVLSTLPALTLVAAELFGVRALGFLLGGPAGWVCLGLGAGCCVLGWRWLDRLRRRITTPEVSTGVLTDVVAEVLSVTGIRSEVEATLVQMAADWNVRDEWEECQDVRSHSRDSGIPVVGLLRAAAEERRRVARFSVRENIEKLPGQMLVPVGVCLFPAFVVLTVIPSIAGMAQGFFRSTS
jgi:tight adherence protein B